MAAAARKHRLAATAPQPEFRWSPLFPRRLRTPAPTPAPTPADETGSPNLYPNCDVSVWLRSCSEEVLKPVGGTTTGAIPQWLTGSLLRNGPGSLKVGDMTFDHLFDSSALLHRFAISNGNVTYQNRFLQSQTFKRNTAAQRIVVTEFGTKSVPDPCQSIFQRVSAFFTPGEGLSDNAMISIYPFGDEFYTFTESPIIHRIDPTSLETLERVNVSKYASIVNHSSHPHVMEDGTVYNLGLTVTGKGPCYAVIKFPPAADSLEAKRTMFDQATIVGKVPARWPLHPGYMHTFGITENFFVIVEQPLSVSVPAMIKNQLTSSPMAASFRWYGEEQTQIHLMCRKTGEIRYTYEAEAFFYLHIINCFEDADHVVVDICCYRDPSMLDCMYVDSLKGIQRNPDYARMFRSRPLRFILPLYEDNVLSVSSDESLVKLKNTKATAYRLKSGRIFACPELLCTLGCETPRINYERNLGRPYRYFYAISSDVDLDNPGTLIKVDIVNNTKKTWSEENVYPSEPIFVPSPYSQEEDDGVVLSALVWGKGQEHKVALLVLDATSWQELGRTVFTTPSPVPKCLHGWFTSIV